MVVSYGTLYLDERRWQEMLIRQAEFADLKDLIEIEQICFPPLEAANAQTIQKRFETFSENFLVAEVEGRVVGFINGCCTDTPFLPDALYYDVRLHLAHGVYQTVFGLDVLPEFRHQGIARALMQALIRLTKQRQKKGIVLTCKAHLIDFYSSFGFKHQGISASTHGKTRWHDMLYLFDQ